MEEPFSTYKVFRFLIIFAGVSGILQSIVWFGLAISGISVYYCTIDFSQMAINFGSILELSIYKIYFSGECTVPNIPLIDIPAQNAVSLFARIHLHIWLWIMMMFSVVWAISSVLIITHVRTPKLKNSNVFLSTWIVITLAIVFIDLAIFILFAIDYGNLVQRSGSVEIPADGTVPAFAVTWLAAQNAAGIMMTIALRGFLLWVINLVLAIYFFVETFNIYNYNKAKKLQNRNGHINNAFMKPQRHDSDREVSLSAFETHSAHPWYSARSTELPRLNRVKRSSSYEEGLNDMFKRRQEPPYGFAYRREDNVTFRRDQGLSQVARELKDRNSGGVHNNNSNLPMPDYSPHQQRSFFNPNRANMKSSRF